LPRWVTTKQAEGINMTIEWQRTPLVKETLHPGQTWAYRLPIEVQGAAPAVQWSSDLLPPSALTADANDPLRLTVLVPTDASGGIGEIAYEIRDVDGPVRGRILVRIQAASAAGRGPGSRDPGKGGRAPLTKTLPPNLPKIWPNTDSGLTAKDGVTAGTAAAPVGDVGIESSSGANVPDAASAMSPPSGPVLRGVFQIGIIRNGVVVPELKRVLSPERTTTIGKSSAKHGIPDLDLQGQFETPKQQDACSRQQAEVFWSEQRVWIKTLGRHPLKFLGADGNPGQDVPKSHCWSPDQVLILPGKLRLVLRQERS
jgi:hypothetical protein